MMNDWFAAIAHSDYLRSTLLAETIQRQARAQLPQRGIRTRCADILLALAAYVAPASAGVVHGKPVLLGGTKR